MMVAPGDEVYEGMIVGIHSRDNDLVVNPLKAKQLTNIRAAGSDENILLTPPVRLSLDGASGGGRPSHRYALITDAPDSVVEGKARQFLQAVQHGDRAAAAGAVSYPLRVNMGANRHLTIHGMIFL